MATFKDQLDKLQEELKKTRTRIEKAEPYNAKKHEDKTRSTLALIFVWGYFIILGVGILVAVINNFAVEYFKLKSEIIISVKDVVSVISGAIGTSLGFVVGYYFKSSEGQIKN
jgi:hypothetical protein